MESSEYNEEEQWSQATWSEAAISQARDEAPSSSQRLLEMSQSLDPGLSPTLLTIPPNIRAIRDQVFCIREEITWTAEQFNEYWAYMDNFWVLNSTRPIKDGKQTLNYWCRLWRESAEYVQWSYAV